MHTKDNHQQKLFVIFILIVATFAALKLASFLRIYTGHPLYNFLTLNIFLAWIPVILSLIIDVLYYARVKRIGSILTVFLGIIWLFFYPNAPYLITDLLHSFGQLTIPLKIKPGFEYWREIGFWYNLMTLLSFGFLGAMLGYFSLYLIHNLVKDCCSKLISWIFVFAVLGFSSFGVFLGRFARLNSWDAFLNPRLFGTTTLAILNNPAGLKKMLLFSGLFFSFFSLLYITLYGFTSLQNGQNNS